MSEKSPRHDEIMTPIIQWAQTRIDLLPNENYEHHPIPSFWTSLYAAHTQIFLTALPQYFIGVSGVREYFREFGSNQEKNDFYDGQDASLARLQETLLNAKPPLHELFNKIITDYGVASSNEPRLLRYVRAYPDIYGDVPALSIVFNYVPMALDVGQKSRDINKQQFGFSLASRLRNEHGWDINPGRAHQLFDTWKTPEEGKFMNSILAANKKGEASKIRLDPESADRVKAYNDAKEVFNQEMSGRFRRPLQRQAAPRFMQSGELDGTKKFRP